MCITQSASVRMLFTVFAPFVDVRNSRIGRTVCIMNAGLVNSCLISHDRCCSKNNAVAEQGDTLLVVLVKT